MLSGRRFVTRQWRGVLAELCAGPLPRSKPSWATGCRFLSTTAARRSAQAIDSPTVALLPDRINPRYFKSPKPGSSLLSLNWPTPPRNLLLVLKLYASNVTESVVEFAKYIRSEYPSVNIVLEPRVAPIIQQCLDFPIYVADQRSHMIDKIDVIATFGGDGTVLRAASLYKLHESVPPILSFSMGTLGFLGEWSFGEHRRAWEELYMSGRGVAEARGPIDLGGGGRECAGGGGATEDCRSSRVLLRHRLKADIFDRSGNNINHKDSTVADETGASAKEAAAAAAGSLGRSPSLRAINEISVHRGSFPHLAIIDIYQNGHFLTETTADGILISTPTGSTAYSLSAGGPIVHPLVKSLLITPISPCSLSFRSLVLPLDTKVCLRISPKNRGQELDLSIDGKRCAGVLPGSEIHVEGEFVGRVGPNEEWHGGVPCVIRAEDDDPWVGGLTGLLKFNSSFGRGPFGDEFPD
ncbi:NADH kinase pos5 [Escovopsis weberi]|uniref:NADH kinase pos5 n=1 Tax=Escovopsis weberi TaxID=150374 RepID=A0A0N0RT47_ESCWE|nr:NADH kinase pos5 [Escovopsis weberi]